MSTIPRDPAPDSTLAILRDGYEYIWKRCGRLHSDVFATRILGQRAVCIHGREAAALFYDENRFRRQGALPRRVVTSLFGKGGVQTLDGPEHLHRKAAFLTLMAPESIARLMDSQAQQWRAAIHRWQRAPSVVLFDEVQCLLTRAVCDWAGVPLEDREVGRRAADMGRMVDAFGGVGGRLWRGKLARARSERWIASLIQKTRRGALQPPRYSALAVFSQHRDRDGHLLDAKLAAVELLNVLRPTAAIAWYVVFAALALHEHPACRDRVARESGETHTPRYSDLFMQEVRRFYPFTPYLGARVRQAFNWRGHHFETGLLVLLDVYGTNHDPLLWEAPDEFRPKRFADRDAEGDPFAFIPQGGGDHSHGHRCPGEWITMHSIDLALHFLTRCMRYEVSPAQDLGFDLSRMPTRPASGFILQKVEALAPLHEDAPSLPSAAALRLQGLPQVLEQPPRPAKPEAAAAGA